MCDETCHRDRLLHIRLSDWSSHGFVTTQESNYNRESVPRRLRRSGGLDQSQAMRYRIVTIALLLSSLAWAKGPSILPSSFNGGKLSPESVKTRSDPAAARPPQFAALNDD